MFKRKAKTETAAKSTSGAKDLASEQPRILTSSKRPPANLQVKRTSVPDTWYKKIWAKYTAKKWLSIPLTILVIAGIIFAIPATRYTILGLFIQKNFTVTAVDNATGKPVSSAAVSLGGHTVTTDNNGHATIKTKLGSTTLKIAKKYYKDYSASVMVTLSSSKNTSQVKLQATGRQVSIVVVNKITTKPLGNVTVKTSDTETKTGTDGTANIVLPADKQTIDATVSGGGYNNLKVSIKVTDQKDPANTFAITPAGTVYFLSRLSGKIDVVKTDLDGANRKTVLAGTGREDQTGTVLLASRDWKFLALLAKRDSDQPKLYLIDTHDDDLTVMDDGNAQITPVGWNNGYFVYQAAKLDMQDWQPKKYALKSYDVTARKVDTLDENEAVAENPNVFAYEQIGSVYGVGDTVVYVKNWYKSAGYEYSSVFNAIKAKSSGIYTVNNDGSVRKAQKTYSAADTANIFGNLYRPQEIYYTINGTNSATTVYAEYDNGSVKDLSGKDFPTDEVYNTYLLSPEGSATFWGEARDGKKTLFIGDANAGSPKQIATLSEYTPYGWYGEDYLLVSKSGSELYIMPRSGGDKALKISDYHKPNYSFNGYGGGYGGL